VFLVACIYAGPANCLYVRGSQCLSFALASGENIA
jgi:hypothetical protein